MDIYHIKVGFNGVYISRTCYPDVMFILEHDRWPAYTWKDDIVNDDDDDGTQSKL